MCGIWKTQPHAKWLAMRSLLVVVVACVAVSSAVYALAGNPSACCQQFKDCNSCQVYDPTSAACQGLGFYPCSWCPSTGSCQPKAETCAPTALNGSIDNCDIEQPFERFRTCEACMANELLGWCPQDERCYFTGRHNHPYGLPGACEAFATVGPFVFETGYTNGVGPCAAIRPTERYTDCTACRKSSYHGKSQTVVNGWCPSEGKCYYAGSQDGASQPANITCESTPTEGPFITGSANICACIPSERTSCSNCTGGADCWRYPLGWCPSTNQCLYGANASVAGCRASAQDGPYQKTGSASCATIDPTHNFTSCSACQTASHTSYSERLGWCGSANQGSGACVALNSRNQPDAGTTCTLTDTAGPLIPFFDNSGTDCNCANPAKQYRDCHACTDSLCLMYNPTVSAGWCATAVNDDGTQGRCLLYNTSTSPPQPLNGTCAYDASIGGYVTQSASCECLDAAANATTCDACLNTAGASGMCNGGRGWCSCPDGTHTCLVTHPLERYSKTPFAGACPAKCDIYYDPNGGGSCTTPWRQGSRRRLRTYTEGATYAVHEKKA